MAGRLALMMAGQRVLQHPGRSNAQTTGILWNDTNQPKPSPPVEGTPGASSPVLTMAGHRTEVIQQ